MDLVRIADGKISQYISAAEKPDGDWLEVDGATFEGYVGQAMEEIDWKTGKKRSDEELVKAGLLKDTRGTYWEKASAARIEITRLGVEIPDEYTSVEPPEDRSFISWEEEAGAWVVDEEAREGARLKGIRTRRRHEFLIFDKYQTVLADELTAEQTTDFAAWREAWLDAPETGIEPDRPDWFREF